MEKKKSGSSIFMCFFLFFFFIGVSGNEHICKTSQIRKYISSAMDKHFRWMDRWMDRMINTWEQVSADWQRVCSSIVFSGVLITEYTAAARWLSRHYHTCLHSCNHTQQMKQGERLRQKVDFVPECNHGAISHSLHCKII